MEQAAYDPFPGHRAKEMLRGKMPYLPDHYLETRTSDWSHDFSLAFLLQHPRTLLLEPAVCW